MSFVFDSLRAHNGCLSLFDVKDLVCEFRRGRGAATRSLASRPRQYRLQRVPVAPSTTEAQATATKPTRVLLPSIDMWNMDPAAIARADSESIARAEATLGIVFLVQENSKIRVIRDDRTRDDLKSAFPDVDESILNEVWSRTRLFTAACPILLSLRNSGHHVAGGGPVDLRLENEDAWPALLEETTSEGSSMHGWEHMPAPEGEEWVLIDEEDEADHSEEDRPAPTGAGGDDTEMRGRTYREVLLLNLMNSGREWPVAPSPRPPLHATVPVVRGKFKKEKLQSLVAFEDDYGYMGNFEAEYYLEKAVAARTHSHLSRKRLTCTGKARMEAKMARRAMVDDDENDVDVEATL